MVDGRDQNGGGLVGYSIKTALDATGNLHVTYMNYSRPAVKYALRTGNAWRIETVEALAAVAYPDRNSLAVDRWGRPWIGYHDSGRGVLAVARRTAAGWKREIVDTDGAGFTSSLDIVDDEAWISYADEHQLCLKVARRHLAPDEIVSDTAPKGANPAKNTEASSAAAKH